MKPRPLSEIPAKYHAEIMGQLLQSTQPPRAIVDTSGITFTGYTNWTLPYPPSANNYWRSIVVHGRGRVVVSKQAKDFKKAVSAALAGISPVSGPVALTATFYRPRKRGDLDNLLKVTCDALKGIAYHDDEQICQITAYRKEDKENPRVELSVQQLAST
jgi:crossover junction endodeoxyribonuclease RusA